MDKFFTFVEGLNNKPNQVAARQAVINVRYKKPTRSVCVRCVRVCGVFVRVCGVSCVHCGW